MRYELDLPNLLQLHSDLPLAPIAGKSQFEIFLGILLHGSKQLITSSHHYCHCKRKIFSPVCKILSLWRFQVQWTVRQPVDGACTIVPPNCIHQSNPLGRVPLRHLVEWRDVFSVRLSDKVVMSDGFCDDPTADVIAVPVGSCETPARVWIFCEVHYVRVHLKTLTMTSNENTMGQP